MSHLVSQKIVKMLTTIMKDIKKFKQHTYTYKHDIKKYLKQRNISEEEAIKYIESSIPYKRVWKMWRFTLYLWARIFNEQMGIRKNRIETVAHIVNSTKYKRLYATFPLPKFDTNNEIKKLTQLIAEPRQDKEFKSKNFVYEGEKRNIPQTVIDKLR